MKVVHYRYNDTLNRAASMDVKRNGALKTLAIGAAVRIQNGETIPVDEFKEVCGSQRYSDLVTRWEKCEGTCIFVEVDIVDPEKRIVSP